MKLVKNLPLEVLDIILDYTACEHLKKDGTTYRLMVPILKTGHMGTLRVRETKPSRRIVHKTRYLLANASLQTVYFREENEDFYKMERILESIGHIRKDIEDFKVELTILPASMLKFLAIKLCMKVDRQVGDFRLLTHHNAKIIELFSYLHNGREQQLKMFDQCVVEYAFHKAEIKWMPEILLLSEFENYCGTFFKMLMDPREITIFFCVLTNIETTIRTLLGGLDYVNDIFFRPFSFWKKSKE